MTSSDIGAAIVCRERSLPIRRLLRALQIMSVLCMLTSAVHNYGLALHGGGDWAAYRWDTGDLHAVQAVVVSLLEARDRTALTLSPYRALNPPAAPDGSSPPR